MQLFSRPGLRLNAARLKSTNKNKTLYGKILDLSKSMPCGLLFNGDGFLAMQMGKNGDEFVSFICST